MLPDPLHPAVVHLPIALAALMPLLAVGALFAIARRHVPNRAWLAVILLQVLLAASAWVAEETGEDEEERVERVVAEQYIEEHADAAEWFVYAAVATALLMATGLLPDRLGRAGRIAGALASLAVLATAVRVGHLGGELVYRHGAASAYLEPGAGAAPPEP